MNDLIKNNMKINKSIIKKAFGIAFISIAFIGCQDMDRPALGDYPVDINPPGGPLKFYVPFDDTTTDPLKFAVDNIRANFPSDNPLVSTTGITGKGVQGANMKFISYSKPNDWLVTSKSLTIATWIKKNGQTQNNRLTNGPEYVFSIPTSNGHWSGGQMMMMIEGNNTAAAIKLVVVDANKSDPWFTWEGGQAIGGLLDNQWHHIALVYDSTTSKFTLYVDGKANPNVKDWANHGNINLDNSTATMFKLGAGPATKYDSDDWLSSTWKGSIDQFRLYGTGLTAAEVLSLFNDKK